MTVPEGVRERVAKALFEFHNPGAWDWDKHLEDYHRVSWLKMADAAMAAAGLPGLQPQSQDDLREAICQLLVAQTWGAKPRKDDPDWHRRFRPWQCQLIAKLISEMPELAGLPELREELERLRTERDMAMRMSDALGIERARLAKTADSVPCPTCDGSGFYLEWHPEVAMHERLGCPTCEGSGRWSSDVVAEVLSRLQADRDDLRSRVAELEAERERHVEALEQIATGHPCDEDHRDIAIAALPEPLSWDESEPRAALVASTLVEQPKRQRDDCQVCKGAKCLGTDDPPSLRCRPVEVEQWLLGVCVFHTRRIMSPLDMHVEGVSCVNWRPVLHDRTVPEGGQ